MKHGKFTKLLLSGLLTCAAEASRADDTSLPTWTDGNGIEWSLLDVKTSFHRGVHRCADIKRSLPRALDFYEAIDYGLLNPAINTAFGDRARFVDWTWVKSLQPTTPSFRYLASRWGDEVLDLASERHWVFCIKRD